MLSQGQTSFCWSRKWAPRVQEWCPYQVSITLHLLKCLLSLKGRLWPECNLVFGFLFHILCKSIEVKLMIVDDLVFSIFTSFLGEMFNSSANFQECSTLCLFGSTYFLIYSKLKHMNVEVKGKNGSLCNYFLFDFISSLFLQQLQCPCFLSREVLPQSPLFSFSPWSWSMLLHLIKIESLS